MEQDTTKLIDEQLKSLPQSLQRAIALTEWRVITKNIATANNLDASKSENLETETMLVMYGFENQNDFPSNVARELEIDQVRADMIAREINEQVFTAVLDKANELESQKEGETLQSATPEPVKEPETTPNVVVEAPKPDDPNKKPINLIPPPVKEEEILLEPPKPESSPASLAPSTPQPSSPKPKDFEERKQSVPEMPSNKPHYPTGNDPYREPIN